MSTANISSQRTPVPATNPAGPSLKTQRIIALALLICQAGITVSGSIVRVTGSGLGCVTWPNCHPGSLVPIQGAAPMLHQAIEFGNRLLTFVVAAAAIASIVAVHKAQRRKELKVYAWAGLAGIFVQALIGALSVVLKLSWWSVAIHFLPSMALVWIAAMLFSRIKEPDDGTPTRLFPAAVRTLAVVAAVALSIVLLTGTFVTGSGTHSGDAGVGMDGRLNMDTETLAYVHAACMYVYLICTLVAVYQLRRTNAPKDAYKTGLVLIALIVIQWAIGVTQFRLGVPRWTIPAHIAMSSAVVAFSAILYAHGKRRLPTLK